MKINHAFAAFWVLFALILPRWQRQPGNPPPVVAVGKDPMSDASPCRKLDPFSSGPLAAAQARP